MKCEKIIQSCKSAENDKIVATNVPRRRGGSGDAAFARKRRVSFALRASAVH